MTRISQRVRRTLSLAVIAKSINVPKSTLWAAWDRGELPLEDNAHVTPKDEQPGWTESKVKAIRKIMRSRTYPMRRRRER